MEKDDQTQAAIARDQAIARFFNLCESLLRRVEPMIDLAIAEEQERRDAVKNLGSVKPRR